MPSRKDLLKVLLIEDDPDTQIVVKAVLEDMNNLYVVGCNSGQEGIRKIRESRPDLILLDIGLPDIDGFDTLSALRAQPGCADIPVIFMTAHPPSASEAEDLGVLHVISKPFDPLVLSVAIEAVWKKRFA